MNLQQIKSDVDNGVLVSPATWHALLDYAMTHMISETDLSALLPGVYYMDPPDGGSLTVMEQLRRMAEDAAAFRERKVNLSQAFGKLGQTSEASMLAFVDAAKLGLEK